jgi:hypothetical protein
MSFLLSCIVAGQALAFSEVGLQQQLRADYAALQQARADLLQARANSRLGSAEEADYRAWIRQLERQVQQDCQALQQTAAVPLADIPCGQFSVENPAPATIDIAAENTRAETTRRMLDQFNGSLGDFDERLLREQERVKTRTPHDDSANGGSANRASGAVDGQVGDEESLENGQADKEAGREKPGDESGKQTTGTGAGAAGRPSPGAGSRIPDDIPDGSDDDVVARQLREAAEKETDPELKKKLWEEYRRYKAGLQ